MRQIRTLTLAITILGLCILAAGCSQGFGIHKRDTTAAKGPADAAQASFAREYEEASRAAAVPDVVATDEPESPSNPAEQRVKLHGLGQPISTNDADDTAPLPAQFTHLQVSDPEAVPLPQGTPSTQQPSKPEPVATPSTDQVLKQFHVDNTDVRKTLETLSRMAKVSILVSPGVSGSITLDLQNKTVDEVLRHIASLCNLTVRREKDVVYVSTPAEVRQSEEDDLPIRVYHLNYARSTDVQAMVQPHLSEKGKMTTSPDSEVGMSSDGSAASVVGGGGGGGGGNVKAGGNSLAGGDVIIVQDYEQVLKKVDRMVAQIDVQPIQVVIEAVIVSVKLNKNMDLGVNFAVLDSSGKFMEVVGNGFALNAATGFNPASVITTGGKLVGSAANGFSENANGIKFGWVGGSTPAFIRALETMGETKVLASPRIMVLNKQPAQLHIGDQLGYMTTTVSQVTATQTVQFMNVGTQLMLRPYVSQDGMIRMEIHPERSTGHLDAAGIPQGNTTTLTSNVLIPDGATIVIGGLIDSQVDTAWQGLPFLSRIPWLGYLFRHTADTTTKTELVVILTPHIWRPDCPEGLNTLGRPKTLNLDRRVGQRPRPESKDAPSLFELVSPQSPESDAPPPAPATDTTAPIPLGKAASPVRR
jgi:general secretion pathway protein D